MGGVSFLTPGNSPPPTRCVDVLLISETQFASCKHLASASHHIFGRIDSKAAWGFMKGVNHMDIY